MILACSSLEYLRMVARVCYRIRLIEQIDSPVGP
jgi:hypothetical protein